ncbi:MAG TPA: tail-specific protease, partial [Cyclobacteriaceae bacterium]|nr:tail-specific protease [Cyclobacteriaceae bacterium]
MMKKMAGFFLGLILVIRGFAAPADTVDLVPSPVFGKEAMVISLLLERNHYRKMKFNDSISSHVLDDYFKELDNSKIYFLASDIQSFEKYRFSLDDLTRAENVGPAYEIYKLFQTRYRTRLNDVVANLVNQNFDYTIDEYYNTDRDKNEWAKSNKELDDVWRKIIKSQALSLKLTGKKQEEIAEVLKKRYERLLKSYNQLNSEDVFSIYMNCITEVYDPHTSYLSPKASALFKESMTLSLEGIGASLQTENDYTKVAGIIP